MSRVVAFRPKSQNPLQFPAIANRRILITGATRGAGAVISHTFAAHGCPLILQSDERAAVARLAAEFGSEPAAVRVFDCAPDDIESATRLTRAALSAFGGVDVVINQIDFTGVRLDKSVGSERCKAVIAEALRIGTVVAEVAGEDMQRTDSGGQILHVAVIEDRECARPDPRSLLLRHAIATLTAAAARSWSQSGVRVNAIVAPEADSDAALEEISAIALELVSEEGPRLSGQVLNVR